MDELNEQQAMIRDAVATLAREKFQPGAARADREKRPPVENLKVLAQNGFCGLTIPEEYGGVGLGCLETVLVMEQVARYCANTAILLSSTDGATPRAILHCGTEAHKKKYLPKFARAELLAAWSMSEADAGSDVGNVKCRAAREGGEFVINGSKLWCSAAQVADVFLVLVRLNDAPGMKGVGALIVEKGTPGFSVGNHLDLIGLRATGMAELVFNNCRVPADNLLIQAGRMRDLFSVINVDRIAGNPPICLGVAEEAVSRTVAYLKDRRQFGKPLAEFQGLQWKLADMVIELEAARALLYRSARLVDAGRGGIIDSSMAKTFVNEMAIRVTNDAMQLHGACGLSEEFPLERMYRDVRGMAIGYGTTQVHRGIVAQEVLEGRYP
jgi:alkylation response protein AidB-like acyl-CoA dehydrogenase